MSDDLASKYDHLLEEGDYFFVDPFAKEEAPPRLPTAAARRAYGEGFPAFDLHHICGNRWCKNPEHLIAARGSSQAAREGDALCLTRRSGTTSLTPKTPA